MTTARPPGIAIDRRDLRRRCARALALVALALPCVALAQPEPECAKVDVMKLTACNQAARVKRMCKGFEGPAYAECEKQILQKPALDDCARLEGYGKAKCETYNAQLDAEFPCQGKSEDALMNCARAEAAKIAPPKAAK